MTSADDSAWLVAIDLQHIFADPGSPWASPDFGRALAGTESLLPAFADRTVCTRFVAPEQPSGAWADYYADWPFALTPADDPQYDLVPAVRGRGRLVSATTFGKWGSDLSGAVDGSRNLVLTGVSTDCCVLSTALAAADAGVHVSVVSDACAGASPLDHERALAAMQLYAPLIELTTVAEILTAQASSTMGGTRSTGPHQ